MHQLIVTAVYVTFASALLLWQTANAQFVPPGIAPTELEQLADDLYTFRYGPYRSLFMVTDEGVIATDPISPEAAVEYRAAIASVTDQPVKYIVYSHAHWDHARGGQIFQQEGATFIAQERCVQNIAESPNPDIINPDITFDTTYKVKLGGVSLDLYYFGPSHGTCLIVMIPQGKGQFAPAPTMGPVIQITERREFWEALMNAVKTEMDSGTQSFMVSSRLDLSPWENIRGFNKRKFKQLVDRIAAYYAIGK